MTAMTTSYYHQLRNQEVSAILAGLCVLSLCLSGCSNSSTTESGAPGTTGVTNAAQSSTECAGSLASAWDQVQPQRLGLSSYKATALAILNQWLSKCGQKQLQVLGDEESDLKRESMSDAQMRRIVAQRFSDRDIEHLRDVIVFRELAIHLMDQANNDVDRLVAIFDHVVRNIDLIADNTDTPALTPFERLMLGQGTAADRAWIFAEILRQAQMDDAVIVLPATGEQNDAWLLGAFADDQLLLFDPRLGLVIPSSDAEGKSDIPRKPASLEELAAEGEILGAFGEGYPLKDDDFKSVRIRAIGESSFWSHRIQVLQAELAGERTVVVFDPFDDETDACQMARLSAAGGDLWSQEDVGIWEYPEQQMTAAELRDESLVSRVESMMGSFDVPLTIEARATMRGKILDTQDRESYDRQLENVIETAALIEHEAVEDLIPAARNVFVVDQEVLADFGAGDAVRFELFIGAGEVNVANFEIDDPSTPFQATVKQKIEKERDQYKTRVMQVMGQINSDVVSGYQQVRLNSPGNLVGTLKTFYDDATQDAMYWSGLCQMENEDYDSAITTLSTYLRTHPEGRRRDTARLLVARMLAQKEDWSKAVETIQPTIDANAPQKVGNEFLKKRWEAQASE